MRQYVPNLRTHRKTGHHRVLFGLRDCHIWQPMLLVTLKILGFVFPTSPLLAFVEIKFQTTEQEGCRNLFRGPFCPYFPALPTMLTVTTDSSCSFGTHFWVIVGCFGVWASFIFITRALRAALCLLRFLLAVLRRTTRGGISCPSDIGTGPHSVFSLSIAIGLNELLCPLFIIKAFSPLR